MSDEGVTNYFCVNRAL